MGKPTRVLIVDDHSVVAEGIRRSLEKAPDFECTGSVSDGLEAVDAVKSQRPDMIVMDVSMPRLNGLDAAEQIKAWDDTIRICIFTMYAERAYVVSAFKTGIHGYVLKDEPVSELILALKAIREGGTYYSGKVRQILKEHVEELELGEGKGAKAVEDGISKLSNREKEVFVLLADGLTPKQIGERLYISPKTAETHKYNILEKLDFHSVAQLTKLAIKKNLIEV
ncbi:MAG: response regulator [Thermodesulfobacteriota bacterium]